MKRIITEYIYDTCWDTPIPVPSYRRIPGPKVRLTGIYRYVNGYMEVEVEEKVWFGLTTRKRFIGEDSFSFTEIEDFNCNN